MKRSARFIICAAVLLLAVAPAGAQTAGSVTAGAQGIYSAPIGALGTWFKPGSGVRAVVGQRTDPRLIWEAVFERTEYTRGNDGSGGLYWSDLEVKLQQYGAGMQVSYFILDSDADLQPYLNGGATVYRWFSKRGRHATDSTNTLFVPELLQDDWSWGFHAGVGVEVPIMSGIAANVAARYSIVNAELWPALALRLENVSGFQSVQLLAGLKYEFEF